MRKNRCKYVSAYFVLTQKYRLSRAQYALISEEPPGIRPQVFHWPSEPFLSVILANRECSCSDVSHILGIHHKIRHKRCMR